MCSPHHLWSLQRQSWLSVRQWLTQLLHSTVSPSWTDSFSRAYRRTCSEKVTHQQIFCLRRWSSSQLSLTVKFWLWHATLSKVAPFDPFLSKQVESHTLLSRSYEKWTETCDRCRMFPCGTTVDDCACYSDWLQYPSTFNSFHLTATETVMTWTMRLRCQRRRQCRQQHRS